MTKRPRYQVRGRDSKVLSKYQLQLELPHFINAELAEETPFLRRGYGRSGQNCCITTELRPLADIHLETLPPPVRRRYGLTCSLATHGNCRKPPGAVL